MHWIYYLLAAVVIIAGFVIFLMYRGYNKIRPKPIKGIFAYDLSKIFCINIEKMHILYVQASRILRLHTLY